MIPHVEAPVDSEAVAHPFLRRRVHRLSGAFNRRPYDADLRAYGCTAPQAREEFLLEVFHLPTNQELAHLHSRA